MRISRADVSLGAVILIIVAGFALSSCEGLGEDDEGPGGTSSAGGSTHRAGQNCNDCHGVQYSGTLYSTANEGEIVAGATIVITEADGNQLTMVTDNSGNFWTTSGNPGGGYNATVSGNSTAMVAGQVNGGCSAGGCHGSTQPHIYTD